MSYGNPSAEALRTFLEVLFVLACLGVVALCVLACVFVLIAAGLIIWGLL